MFVVMVVIIRTSLTVMIGGDVLTVGHLTGSQRRPGDREYARPVNQICGKLLNFISRMEPNACQRTARALHLSLPALTRMKQEGVLNAYDETPLKLNASDVIKVIKININGQ